MTIIVNLAGHVNFDNTRAVVVGSATFADGQADFGAGVENRATCPGCGRILPSVCMHLDHILSQSNHRVSLGGPDEEVRVRDAVPPHNASTTFGATLSGGTVTIFQLGSDRAGDGGGGPVRHNPKRASVGPYAGRRPVKTITVIHTHAAWENDVENLQFLCMMCNTSKGAREFRAHFPGRVTRAFIPPA